MNKISEQVYMNLEFTNDFIFCKILENNLELCKELLELILGIKLKKVECISKQKTIEITSDGKGIRLDVYVEDDNNSVFDIEMQTTKAKDLPKRSRYYQGMIDINLIERGAKYRKLKKSYIIFICLEDPFELNLPVYHFENTCRENNKLVLGDESIKVFVNPEGKQENLSEDMKAFLDYLRGIESDNHLVKKLQYEVEKARNHEEWRTEYMTLHMRDEEKREEGALEMLVALVKKGLLTIEQAAEEMEMTIDEFQEKMDMT